MSDIDLDLDRLPAPTDGGTYAHRCGTCHGLPCWTLVREGDAVVTWSCDGHLHRELDRLQQPHRPSTTVRVTRLPRSDRGQG